jgi:hypothetical protein
MWGPCNNFHNCCQNSTETRGSKIGKRLLICCVKISQFCSNSVVRCTYLFSPSPQSSPVVGCICVSGTHTLLMLSVCELMFSWTSSLLPLPVMLLLLLLWWGHFFHFSFVPNMFPRLPIAPGFNPICFAQSPPLLTYIAGPKEMALWLSIESPVLGSLYSFNFCCVIGRSNWLIAKNIKRWTC